MAIATARDGVLDVPVIDIAAFADGSPAQRAAIASAVQRAAAEVGFMQITGHGIPEAVLAGLTSAMDAFFAQPAQAKRAARPQDVAVNRGYSGPKSERLSYSLGVGSPADLFEAFNIGAPASDFPDLALPVDQYPENIWPAEPTQFAAQTSAWFAEAARLARLLTRIFAVALGLDEQYFAPFEDHSIDVLRMNNYRLPADDVRLEPGQLGMGPHTDYGIVTILWADNVRPGLQILASDGAWHDVLPAPGALLVNLGDLLARWTNDRWISTMHRVLAPVDDDGRLVHRRSAAYFHDGNHDAVIACLPGCEGAAGPLYEPVTVAEHLSAKLAGSRGLALNAGAARDAARLGIS